MHLGQSPTSGEHEQILGSLRRLVFIIYKNGFLDKMSGLNQFRMHWYYGMLVGSGWDVVQSKSHPTLYYWLKDDAAIWAHRLCIHYDGDYYIYDFKYPDVKYLV